MHNHANSPWMSVDGEDIKKLQLEAPLTQLKRARICAHRSSSDALHEMIIVLERETYVRPHRHPGKTESFHVIEGVVTVIFFNETGSVSGKVRLGAYGGPHPFYYRLNDLFYHTLVIESPQLVIHETTNGPFRPEETEFADWAPENGSPLADRFIQRLREECR